jgi:hypothetical protein
MHPRCGACLHGWAVRDPPSCRGQAVPDPPAREGREPRGEAMGAVPGGAATWSMRATVVAAPVARRARQRLAPTRWGVPHPGRVIAAQGSVNAQSCRGQAVPDPPARQGRGMAPSPGYGWRSRRGWAPAVRPGLKPRAESPSPLKGAVRRPGARVDRLGAGAGGISRLQPAWGLSPAVHGRAIVDTAARLIRAACRARRVGRAESPRPWRGRVRQRLAPPKGDTPAAEATLIPVASSPARRGSGGVAERRGYGVVRVQAPPDC